MRESSAFHFFLHPETPLPLEGSGNSELPRTIAQHTDEGATEGNRTAFRKPASGELFLLRWAGRRGRRQFLPGESLARSSSKKLKMKATRPEFGPRGERHRCTAPFTCFLRSARRPPGGALRRASLGPRWARTKRFVCHR